MVFPTIYKLKKIYLSYEARGLGKKVPQIKSAGESYCHAESGGFRGLVSPLHDAELSEALARLIARMRKLSAIGKPWAMTERLQLTTENATLFLRKYCKKNIVGQDFFARVDLVDTHERRYLRWKREE